MYDFYSFLKIYTAMVINQVSKVRLESDRYQWNYIPANLNPIQIPPKECSIEKSLTDL